MNNDTVIVYTYRYFFKNQKGELSVKFLTETQEGHAKFQSRVLEDTNVVSCIREYVSEVNFSYLGFTEPVKVEKKESEEIPGMPEDSDVNGLWLGKNYFSEIEKSKKEEKESEEVC